MRMRTVISLIPKIMQLFMQLFWLWITLDWRIRKARKAFEKELIRNGIAKKDAQRLSRQIKIAKDQIMDSIWHFSPK